MYYADEISVEIAERLLDKLNEYLDSSTLFNLYSSPENLLNTVSPFLYTWPLNHFGNGCSFTLFIIDIL